MLVEVLSGVLSGSGVAHGVGRLYEDGTGRRRRAFHLALDPERLIGRARSEQLLERLCSSKLKAVPSAPGSTRSWSPASPRRRAKAERERDGIPLPPTLWVTLEELSGELGVPSPARD